MEMETETKKKFLTDYGRLKHNESMRKYRAKNREKVNAKARENYKKRIERMTEEEKNELRIKRAQYKKKNIN